MQNNLSDNSLFPETQQNITSTTSIDELNDNTNQNNLSYLSSSSSYSYTENSNDTDFYTSSSEVNSNATNSQGYSSEDGYGTIDAGAALGEVIGEDSFEEVPDTGGKNSGADAVNAPEVWEQGYTGEGVVVAVLDTGVDYNHNDLEDNIWTNSGEIANNGIDDDGNGYIDDFYGWNFDGNNNNTMDVDGHGTHVAGTIAGMNNDYGVTGIAYDSQIMPVKVLDDNGSGTNTSVANGIYYAVDNGADVINLSLGGDFPSLEIETAIEYADAQGVIVVMAAGNSGDETPIYPASYADEYGIAVGAIDEDGDMADFSNHAGSDTLTYVTAPGVDIYSTLPDNRYDSYSGTSMATPHVSGVVALMLSADPTLENDQITQILKETSSNNTQTETVEYNFQYFIQNISFESIFDAEYMMEFFNNNFNFTNTTVVNASSDINKSVNQYLESQFITYKQNTLGNNNNRTFSSDIESMLEESDFLW